MHTEALELYLKRSMELARSAAAIETDDEKQRIAYLLDEDLDVLVSTIVQLEAAHLRLQLNAPDMADELLCPLEMIRAVYTTKRALMNALVKIDGS